MMNKIESVEELPKDWRWVELGSICEIIAGQSPPGSTYRSTPEGLPFFQGKADFGRINPVPRVWCVQPKKIAKPGDILISVRAPVGPTNIANIECCIGRGLAAIRCGNHADRDFVLDVLRHLEIEIQKKASGSTFTAISRNDLEDFRIPFPPLTEQKRITTIFKEQMVSVENARAAAQTRLEAIKALPATFLRQVFPQPGQTLPRGWRWVKLGEVTQLINGRACSSGELLDKGKYPVLRVGNLFTNNHWYYSDMELDSEKYCEKGDLIYAWSASFGSFIWQGPKAIFHYHIWKILCGEHIYTEYARYALQAITASIKNDSDGLAMLHMTKGKMLQIKIPLPPLSAQKCIVKMLNDQMTLVNISCVAAKEELKTINTLPVVLLRQIFGGKT